MIVRIFTEGQYRLGEDALHRLHELDRQVASAAHAGDEERFGRLYRELLDHIRQDGERLPDEDLSQSDIMLPPPDSSAAEVQREFTGDGLLPD